MRRQASRRVGPLNCRLEHFEQDPALDPGVVLTIAFVHR
jgi:hypothetical protein